MKNGKREGFKFVQARKKLSDRQYFSKIYYHHYKETIASVWDNIYITYRHHLKKDSDSTVAGVKELSDSIRKDLGAKRLHITVAAESGIEGKIEVDIGIEIIDKNKVKVEVDEDKDMPNPDEYMPDPDGDIEENDGDQDQEEEDVPKVPIWYQNVMMKKIWEKARPWQKDEVKQYKINESKTAEVAGDEMEEDEQQKVT